MNTSLILLAALALNMNNAQALFKKIQPTKKEVIYLKCKSFLGNKITLCSISACLGAGAVLAWEKYRDQIFQTTNVPG